MLAEGVVGESAGMRGTAVGETANAHGDEGVDVSDWKLLHLLVELLNQSGPIVQADLENLTVFDLTDSD